MQAPQQHGADWGTRGGLALGGGDGKLSAEELRQKTLEAAEKRQIHAPGMTPEQVVVNRERQQREELLGKHARRGLGPQVSGSSSTGRAPGGRSGGQSEHERQRFTQTQQGDWGTRGLALGVGLSAERQKRLEAAEQRQNHVPGMTPEQVVANRERQLKEELLGKLREHHNRKKTEMPMGLNAATAEQLKRHWDQLRGPDASDVLLQT